MSSGMMGGGINPLFGANPFAMGNMANPFIGSKMHEPENGSFNVDDLVKRIDAKIAELEEEERKEKELEERNKNVVDKNEPVIVDAKIEEPIKESNDAVIVEQTNVEPPKANEVSTPKQDNKLYIDDTDDENFFDDFFADE